MISPNKVDVYVRFFQLPELFDEEKSGFRIDTTPVEYVSCQNHERDSFRNRLSNHVLKSDSCCISNVSSMLARICIVSYRQPLQWTVQVNISTMKEGEWLHQ